MNFVERNINQEYKELTGSYYGEGRRIAQSTLLSNVRARFRGKQSCARARAPVYFYPNKEPRKKKRLLSRKSSARWNANSQRNKGSVVVVDEVILKTIVGLVNFRNCQWTPSGPGVIREK